MNVAVICENSTEYARRLADGIGAFAEKHDWRLYWYSLASPPEGKALADCDGVIARIANDQMAETMRQLGIPVVDVFCLRERPGIIAAMPDHKAIGRAAALHLLSKHYPSFAFAGFKNILFSDGRLEGFKTELKRHGHIPSTYEINIVEHHIDLSAPQTTRLREMRQIKKWIRSLSLPVAAFAANDYLAVNLMRCASEVGISTPREMAILGVDNDRFLCVFASTPISSIDPNPFGVGHAAARILNAVMKKAPDAKSHPAFHVRPKGVIERASTGHHAIQPEWLATLLDHIDASVGKPLSTADLVELSGLSTVTVCKAFAHHLRTTPLKYITKTKMETARRLLENEDLMVKEVAARVGYNSPIRFSIVYRDYWGHSPCQKRNTHSVEVIQRVSLQQNGNKAHATLSGSHTLGMKAQ